MTAQARFTQADVKRALLGAKGAGFQEVRVRIATDGQIEVIVGKAANDTVAPVEFD